MSDTHVFASGFVAGALAASGPQPDLAAIAGTATIGGIVGLLVTEVGERVLTRPPERDDVIRHWTLAGAFLGLLLVVLGVL